MVSLLLSFISPIVGIIGAILVLLAGIPSGASASEGASAGAGPHHPAERTDVSARRAKRGRAPKPEAGLEPVTYALQERCSTN